MGLIKCCCVGGCNSTNETHRLFVFPKNDNLRKLWLSFLVPTNSLLSGLSKDQLLRRRVCEKHFDEQQFDAEGRRLRYSYPCLFADDEIAHGVPLYSPATDTVSDHNYYKESMDDDDDAVIGRAAPSPSKSVTPTPPYSPDPTPAYPAAGKCDVDTEPFEATPEDDEMFMSKILVKSESNVADQEAKEYVGDSYSDSDGEEILGI